MVEWRQRLSKKHILILGILVLFVSVGLSGCETAEYWFFGTWTANNQDTYEFRSDYTVIINNITSKTWKLEDKWSENGLLVFTNGDKVIFQYKFSDNHDTLTLTNTISNEKTILTKY